MGRCCRNFLHIHKGRPETTTSFLLKLKKFDIISSFDTSCSKYFEQRSVPSWHLTQSCNTGRCCVSLIRCCGLFISEMLIWNNSLNFFPRFCVRKQKPADDESCMSLFISTIWLPQGHFYQLIFSYTNLLFIIVKMRVAGRK